MSDLLWTAYFVVGGFYAGPIVFAAFEDIKSDSPAKDKGDSDAGGALMLMVIVALFCWLAWPLAYSFKRAMDAKPKPAPNPRSGTGE